MEIKQHYLTKNKCYSKPVIIKPIGFMLHSTGANNTELRRYIQPDDGFIGVNKHNNSWNDPDLKVMVHGFIGTDINGQVRAYQTLPYNYKAWHCGGTGNSTHVSWEICEDDLTNEKYFNEVYQVAVDVAYQFCKEFGYDESCICDHAEGNKRGIASNHGDVFHWFRRFNKTMDDFRLDVGLKLKGSGVMNVKYGQVGAEVKRLQSELNKLGYGLVEDGSYGNATKNAVINFQNKYKLTATGNVDVNTWAKLLQVTSDLNKFNPIKFGMVGERVKEIQLLLIKHGAKLAVDSSYGNATRGAVVVFQNKSKIPTSGIVDEVTYNALKKEPVQTGDYVYKKHSNGLHTVEIDPLKLKIVTESTTGKKSKLKNLINGSFVWWTDANKTQAYPTSVVVFDGKIIRNAQPNGYAYQGKEPSYPNGVPTPTFIIYKDGNVEIKLVNSFTKDEANKIHLAVSGVQILPTLSEVGFTPYVSFSTVGYQTMRVAIGYNSKTKKVILAYRDSTSAVQMKYYMKDLCDISLSLDSGGSGNFDVDGMNINRTTRYMYTWITW